MKSDARRNPEDRTTQSEVKIVAEKDGISRLKRRTTQSEVKFIAEIRKIASFGQIFRNKKIPKSIARSKINYP